MSTLANNGQQQNPLRDSVQPAGSQLTLQMIETERGRIGAEAGEKPSSVWGNPLSTAGLHADTPNHTLRRALRAHA